MFPKPILTLTLFKSQNVLEKHFFFEELFQFSHCFRTTATDLVPAMILCNRSCNTFHKGYSGQLILEILPNHFFFFSYFTLWLLCSVTTLNLPLQHSLQLSNYHNGHQKLDRKHNMNILLS